MSARVRWSVRCGQIRWRCMTRKQAGAMCADLVEQGFERARVHGRLG